MSSSPKGNSILAFGGAISLASGLFAPAVSIGKKSISLFDTFGLPAAVSLEGAPNCLMYLSAVC